MKKEWLRDAFGTQMKIGDFAMHTNGLSLIKKSEVIGATEKSIRFGNTESYAGKTYYDIYCKIRSSVALCERTKIR